LLATLRSIFIQVLIFFVIFQGISFIRETSMVANNTNISATNNLLFTQVPTLMGEPISLNAQGKTTVIYFFAPWCQVCHVSIGNLQSLYEKNEHIDVIAVALDYRDTNEIMAFTKQHQLTFPIALGNETIKHAFSISAYPSYYVINEQNTTISKSLGYSSELGLYLRTLL